MASLVYHTDGTVRQVKNLGYLLRNWKVVNKFEVYEGRQAIPVDYETTDPYDNSFSKSRKTTILRAIFSDGRIYETDWATAEGDYSSSGHIWEWLKRPVFIGVPVNWFGKEYVIAKG